LAGDFSKSLREISTLMDNVTEKDIKKMSKELRVLSGASGLALDSLSKAKYDIVSAGFANAADSAEVLAVSAKLAVGGVTTAASAADILTTALNAYGKSAKESEKVADILFTTVKFGKTTMDELSASLGRVLPLARASKASLETVGAAMATLTSSGIKTAEATTFLRGALQALDAPTKAAAKEMFDAGISAKHFDDGSLDLLSTIKQFRGMDTKTLTKFIPSQEAITAILTMSNNIDVLADNLAGFEDTAGAAETAFGKMAKEFNVKMSRLKNNISSALIEFGTLIIEKITPIIDSFNKVLGKLGEIGWDVIAKDLTDNWRDVLGVMGQLVGIMLKPIPATIAGLFMLAGKLAVEAFKLGFEALKNVDWGALIFGSGPRKNAMALAKVFGKDVAQEFINKGVTGFLDDQSENPIAVFMQKAAKEAGGQVGPSFKRNISKVVRKEFDEMGVDISTQLLEVLVKPFIQTAYKGKATADDLQRTFDGFVFAPDMDIDAEMAIIRATWVDEWGFAVDDANVVLTAFYNGLIARNTVAVESVGQEMSIMDTYIELYQKLIDKQRESNAVIEESNELPRANTAIEAWGFAYETEINNVQGMLSNFTAAWSQNLDQRVNAEISALKDTARYQNADAERREDMERGILQNYASEQKLKFRVSQASALAEIGMNTATALTKSVAGAWETIGQPWFSIIAALGVAQTALVLSQKPPEFHSGGLVGGQGDTPIMAQSGEFVLSRSAVQDIGVDTAQRINQGGGAGITVNINAPLVDETVRDSIIPAIQKAQRLNLA
jgi:TP901 family phage tail tape measure protein